MTTLYQSRLSPFEDKVILEFYKSRPKKPRSMPIEKISAENFIQNTNFIEELQKRQEKYRSGINAEIHDYISTGYVGLDRIMHGFSKSQLTVLASRKYIDKSTFMLSMLEHIAIKAKVPVGIVGFNGDRNKLMHKMICMDTRIDSQRLLNADITDHEYELVAESLKRFEKTRIRVNDALKNIDDVKIFAEIMTSNYKNPMIIVDKIQGIKDVNKLLDSSVEDSYVEADNQAYELKNISREYNIPVLVLSDLTNVSSDREEGYIPKLSDLAFTSALEHNADVVMALHKKELEEDFKIMVLKNRFGPTGTCTPELSPTLKKLLS